MQDSNFEANEQQVVNLMSEEEKNSMSNTSSNEVTSAIAADKNDHGRPAGNFGVRNYFALRDAGMTENDIRKIVEGNDEEAIYALVTKAKTFLKKGSAIVETSSSGRKGRRPSSEVMKHLEAKGITSEVLNALPPKERQKKLASARNFVNAVKNGFTP